MAATLFVKICGITSSADAKTAIDAGADALGFIFYPKSPRFLDLEHARHIIRDLPRGIAKVGVFVNEPRDLLEQYIEGLSLDYVQLHGSETPQDCKGLPANVIKGLRIKSMNDISSVPDYPVAFYLLDAFSESEFGGTGHTFDWSIAVEAKKILGSPVILSGGLTPENVAGAVTGVRPYGIDVSSGVEISPGRKDPEKIKAFIANARKAGKESG